MVRQFRRKAVGLYNLSIMTCSSIILDRETIHPLLVTLDSEGSAPSGLHVNFSKRPCQEFGKSTLQTGTMKAARGRSPRIPTGHARYKSPTSGMSTQVFKNLLRVPYNDQVKLRGHMIAHRTRSAPGLIVMLRTREVMKHVHCCTS